MREILRRKGNQMEFYSRTLNKIGAESTLPIILSHSPKTMIGRYDFHMKSHMGDKSGNKSSLKVSKRNCSIAQTHLN